MITAILMAAGRGTRISRDINDSCKCTLDIGGISLIRYTVEMLLERNIEVHIVVGYNKETIKNALVGLDVIFHENVFYSITNSMASLWMARSAIKGDKVILGNADVYWERNLLDILLQEARNNVMLCDSSRVESGDYLFKVENDRIVLSGKGNNCPGANCEYVGLAAISGEMIPLVVERLNQLIEWQNHNYWWEEVLYSMKFEHTIWAQDISGSFWAEIDYLEDYKRILEHRKNVR